MLPTTANKFGGGEAPDETLGLPYDLREIVPFGTFGYHHTKGRKIDFETDLVIVIRFNHEGPGYRALRVSDGQVYTSVHIRPAPGIAGMQEVIEAAKKTSTKASAFIQEHFNLVNDQLDLTTTASGLVRELMAPEPGITPATPTLVQVGDAPGNGGSRVSLKPRASAPPATASAKQPIMDRERAQRVIRDARAVGQVLRWKPGCNKVGKSNERAHICKLRCTKKRRLHVGHVGQG
jgi:hypothetical protein